MKHRDSTKENERIVEREYSGFTARHFPPGILESHELFAPIAVENYELFNLWKRLAASDQLRPLNESNTGLTGGSGGGIPYWNEGVINSPHSYLRDDDVWIVDDETDESVHARHKHTGDTIDIPRTVLKGYFHRYAQRGFVDVTDLSEYTVVDPFDRIGRFMKLSQRDGIPDGWMGHVERREAYLGIPDRFNFTAPGTRHVTYYSGKRRMFHRMWMLPNIDKEEAKMLAVWFNSTIGLLQFLLQRIPYQGGWGKYHRHTLEPFKMPDLANLNTTSREDLLDVFERMKTVEFPSLVEQIVRNTPEEGVSADERGNLKELFADTELLIEGGFDLRVKMDRAVLNTLEVPSHEQDTILEQLYPALLTELISLKQLMK